MFSLNLYPDSNQLAQAYVDLLKYFKWKNFVVLFSTQMGKNRFVRYDI